MLHSKNTTSFQIVSHLESDSFGPNGRERKFWFWFHFTPNCLLWSEFGDEMGEMNQNAAPRVVTAALWLVKINMGCSRQTHRFCKSRCTCSSLTAGFSPKMFLQQSCLIEIRSWFSPQTIQLQSTCDIGLKPPPQGRPIRRFALLLVGTRVRSPHSHLPKRSPVWFKQTKWLRCENPLIDSVGATSARWEDAILVCRGRTASVTH